MPRCTIKMRPVAANGATRQHVGSVPRYSPTRGDAPVSLLRARARADLRPRAVVLVAFFPPIAGLLSRRPRAPTCDLPSRSC
jgi:hypothetical protein